MSKLPTDRDILECIYREYAAAFQDFKREDPSRSAKIYVPIDVRHLAAKLNTDAHELFGRLYYHLDNKHRYKEENNSVVHLFAFKVGSDMHCINYPYLAAVLSERRVEDFRSTSAFWLSIGSLVLAAFALGAQLLGSGT